MGSGGIAPPFLASALDGGEWSASLPGRFTPGERAARYPLYLKLGRPSGRSGRYGEEKNIVSAGNRTPAVQPVDVPTELSRLLRLSAVLKIGRGIQRKNRVNSLGAALTLNFLKICFVFQTSPC
jgi:hypothetical protein